LLELQERVSEQACLTFLEKWCDSPRLPELSVPSAHKGGQSRSSVLSIIPLLDLSAPRHLPRMEFHRLEHLNLRLSDVGTCNMVLFAAPQVSLLKHLKVLRSDFVLDLYDAEVSHAHLALIGAQRLPPSPEILSLPERPRDLRHDLLLCGSSQTLELHVPLKSQVEGEIQELKASEQTHVPGRLLFERSFTIDTLEESSHESTIQGP